VASSGQAAETECSAGSYEPNTGAVSCEEAQAGHYAASSGQAAQTECSAGFYESNKGATSCLPCPAGDTTAGTGSTSASQCFLKLLVIETTSLPGAKRGTPYTDELKASGGIAPYTWKKVGALPKGLKLTTTGVISGTLSTKLAPLYPIRVKVTDSRKKGKHSVTATLMLNVS
jgi:hypothetical protein